MNTSNILFKGFPVPDSPFYDSKNYPHGFSRSGEFTINQANILNVLGRHLMALALGQQKAVTQEEGLFVKVCLGQMPATTEVEKAWQKYKVSINEPLEACLKAS